MTTLDQTHAADAKSWVESANVADVDFPIQNLPFCAFETSDRSQRLGVGIGSQILDLKAAGGLGLLDELGADVVAALSDSLLNRFMELGRPVWKQTRAVLFSLLQDSGELSSRATAAASELMVEQSGASLKLAMHVGDFTDFECSHHHSKRMSLLMSNRTTPLPNGAYLPRAYHGRSSSVIISGDPLYMPVGQIEHEENIPKYKLCQKYDYELELGIIVGTGNERGNPIPIDEAEDHIFGFCILNDWSARDIQKWERLPLGPFLGKNHATMISPWVVTMEAMTPFRAPQPDPGPGWPDPLPYLHSERNEREGGLDVQMDIHVTTEKMREDNVDPYCTSRNRFLDAHWTISQFIAQHTCNGCNLRAGDLIGSGTISGKEVHASACLIELTELGRKPFTLPNGEERGFLRIGDEVVFRGEAVKEGYPRIGFGEVRGRILEPLFEYDAE